MPTRAALVTGGSRGIGRAICLELAGLGYSVAVNYVARADAAEEVAGRIVSGGGRACALRADVGSAGERADLLRRTVQAFGRLDLLVNNAGVTSPGRKDLLEATEEGWDRVMATNLKGPFFLAQSAARTMIDQIRQGRIPEGKIVNISSISAYAVSADRADYCLAKAALSMMTRLFAARLAAEKIGVYEVCPGVIRSDMTAAAKAKYDQAIADGAWPIRRWGRPEDVARAVAAIVSDYFPFSTGGRFDVDGGFHIRRL
jgi:NAD(P)-dependent dehydrogenase (short-subunit alcohol dehydrogenase family)